MYRKEIVGDVLGAGLTATISTMSDARFVPQRILVGAGCDAKLFEVRDFWVGVEPIWNSNAFVPLEVAAVCHHYERSLVEFRPVTCEISTDLSIVVKNTSKESAVFRIFVEGLELDASKRTFSSQASEPALIYAREIVPRMGPLTREQTVKLVADAWEAGRATERPVNEETGWR